MGDENDRPKLEKLEKHLNLWKSRSLSLVGKSTQSTQNLTPYYEKCFSILASLRGIVSRQEWRDFVFSSKKCYLALLRENSASPILHRFWSAFLPIDFDLDRFWVSVRDDFSENPKNDILWLIVLRAVKVRDSLKNWGYIDSDKCASCSRKETIDHCFLNCVRVKRVWSFFSPVLNSLAVGVHQVLLPLTPLGEHGPTALCRQVFVHLWPARLARYMVFPVFLQHRPPRHRPELEGGAWCAVYGAAPGILRTVSSPCLFLWSDHRISRSPLLLLSVSAKCSVVVAIVVVQFLLHVSGSLGASRSFQL